MIAIIAILLGLVLPAVQRTRTAASRASGQESLTKVIQIVQSWKSELEKRTREPELAEPVLPARTGMLNVIANGSGGPRAVLHPSAVEAQKRMFEQLQTRGELMIHKPVAGAAPRF